MRNAQDGTNPQYQAASARAAALGEVLNAPYMVYNRSKSSNVQFAPFTNAAGEQFANSINGF